MEKFREIKFLVIHWLIKAKVHIAELKNAEFFKALKITFLIQKHPSRSSEVLKTVYLRDLAYYDIWVRPLARPIEVNGLMVTRLIFIRR